MTARTPAERVADSKARKRAAGMVEVRSLWANPADVPEIRAFAAKVSRRRARSAGQQPKET